VVDPLSLAALIQSPTNFWHPTNQPLHEPHAHLAPQRRRESGLGTKTHHTSSSMLRTQPGGRRSAARHLRHATCLQNRGSLVGGEADKGKQKSQRTDFKPSANRWQLKEPSISWWSVCNPLATDSSTGKVPESSHECARIPGFLRHGLLSAHLRHNNSHGAMSCDWRLNCNLTSVLV
jgi:hypothetical protein